MVLQSVDPGRVPETSGMDFGVEFLVTPLHARRGRGRFIAFSTPGAVPGARGEGPRERGHDPRHAAHDGRAAARRGGPLGGPGRDRRALPEGALGGRHAHVRGIFFLRFTRKIAKRTILVCVSPSLVKRCGILMHFTIFLNAFLNPDFYGRVLKRR